MTESKTNIDSMIESIRDKRVEQRDILLKYTIREFLASKGLSVDQLCSGYIVELRDYQDRLYEEIIIRERRKYERKQKALRDYLIKYL